MTDLYEKRAALRLIADEAEAALLDCEAEIAVAEKDPLYAAYKRAAAGAVRNGTPEARAAAHRACVVYVATMHLKSGKAPTGDDAAEIEQVMDELRNASPAPSVTANDQPGA